MFLWSADALNHPRPFSHEVVLRNTNLYSRCCWTNIIDEFTDQLSVLFCFPSTFWVKVTKHSQANRLTHIPAARSNPSYLSFSSELLSMPAVKRFSVSFARHPTNGMSAFIQVYFDNPPAYLLSCMTLWWENSFLVFFIGDLDILTVVMTWNWLQEFLFHHTAWCLCCCRPSSLTPTVLPAHLILIYLSDPAVCSQRAFCGNISSPSDVFPYVDNHS